MLYREIIERKKLPMATFLIMMLCAFIYLHKFVTMVSVGDGSVQEDILILAISLSMGMISVIAIYRTVVRYKYSIIADQFIIHKIVRNSNTAVESIKFKDVKFIGKASELKENYKVASSKKYLCSVFNSNKYCCVYADGNVLRKFYFEPSKEMINKLKFMMSKDEECIYVRNKVSISI